MTSKGIGINFEKLICKWLSAFRARLVPQSGAGVRKGDIETDYVLVDTKITQRNSYMITSYIWGKIEKEALEVGKIPALIIRLGDQTEFAAISLSTFYFLCEKLEGDAMKYDRPKPPRRI